MSQIEQMNDEPTLEISWMEIFLFMAGLSLIFQIWPKLFFKTADIIYDSLDLTTWGWKSYAMVNVLAFIALAVIRIRQNQQ
jgi:hypothetical protein